MTTLDQFEIMTAREREALADRIGLELLKPSHDFMAHKVGEKTMIPAEPPPPDPEAVFKPVRRARKQRQHGTVSGYTGGCRCEPCSDAKKAYDARTRTRQGGRVYEKVAPFTPLHKAAMSGMTFERRPINPEEVRGRALEERSLTDFNAGMR